MKILALDSSGLVASVAITEDGNLIADYTVNYKKTHSQTLLPMLQEIKDMVELDLESIDAIAIAAGPGSFTGLRIGSATAKGLGLALNKPIIEIPTVDGLAYNLYGSNKYVCPIMDARRNQVYTGIYRFDNETVSGGETCSVMQVVKPQCAVDISEIIKELNELGGEVVFLGDGVPVFKDRIANEMQIPYGFAPAHQNRQRASAVGALGMRYYAEGKTESAAEHQPDYLRLSQAERERAEKHADIS